MTDLITPIAADIDALTAGYLSALKSNSDEITHLAEALRRAETERDAACAERNQAITDLIETRLALANAEACRAEAEKQANVLIVELDTTRIERDAAHAAKQKECQDRIQDNHVLLSQLDDARADADALERTTQMLIEMFAASLDDNENPDNYLCITEAKSALAAHRAATGQAVTG